MDRSITTRRFRPWVWRLAVLGGIAVVAGLVGVELMAQPAGQGETQTASGRVQQFTKAPLGEVDGCVLDDGTVVHWPPHLERRVTRVVSRGDRIRVTGCMETGPAGDTHLEAQAISDLSTGGSVELDAAPEALKKEKKDKDRKGKGKGEEGKAAKDLRKAYDTLFEVSVLQRATGGKPTREATRFLDYARDFYRSAHERYQAGQRREAAELAKAANDAARGLKHELRASMPVPAGLPAPPAPGEAAAEAWTSAREELQRARDRIEEIVTPALAGPGKVFLEAARDLYDRSRRAYTDREYFRAAELARGAEAWTHVAEHLERGGYTSSRAAEGPAPPPPPPALGDKEAIPAPRRN